jgi:hypothetical protein
MQFLAKKDMSRLNALSVCGFKTAEANLEDLKNPDYEKYFTIFSRSEDQ